MNSPPFVLFVVDEGINNEYINQTLERARDWGADTNWDLWLATDSYKDMPRDPPDRIQPDGTVLPPVYGTEPPIPDLYKSPWYGKTVEECARWLRDAPDDVASDKRHFAAMNKYSKEDDTVLMCRIKEDDSSDAYQVEYFPLATKYIAMYLHTSNGSMFEEPFGRYQDRMIDEGKPDRSQGGPYMMIHVVESQRKS